MASPALSVHNLSKTFAGTRALSEVDFEIQPGEIRALVGQNGCGKSTMIKVLAGVHTPDPGAGATVDGAPLALGSGRAAEAAGLRFVHQDLGLVATLDTTDNLALGPGYDTRRSGLINWGAARRRSHEALAELGYDLDVRRPTSELTAAEGTAVAVARALSQRSTPPRVLVLDEPTANLPGAEAERFLALVRGVRDSGVAVIFVSHYLREVLDLCDSVTVLRDGAHVVTRSTAGLTEPELVTLMIGRELEKADVHPASAVDQGGVLLEVTDVSTSVLDHVSFSVRAGEVVGVAGITGSGREQVASALFGAIPRHGTVQVGSTTLPAARPDLAMAAGMGFVPSERHANAAFLESSVRENVSVADPTAFVRRVFLSRRREQSDVEAWLAKLTVRPTGTERPMSTLSGGNQQKVVLARWLRREPDVLVLDEPTQGVDVGSKVEIHSFVDQVARAGTAVVVASTDHEELTRLCDRVLVFDGGVVVEQLHRPNLTADRITSATLHRDPATAHSDPAPPRTDVQES